MSKGQRTFLRKNFRSFLKVQSNYIDTRVWNSGFDKLIKMSLNFCTWDFIAKIGNLKLVSDCIFKGFIQEIKVVNVVRNVNDNLILIEYK